MFVTPFIKTHTEHRTCKRMASAASSTPVEGIKEKVTALYRSWKSPITADVVYVSVEPLSTLTATSSGSNSDPPKQGVSGELCLSRKQRNQGMSLFISRRKSMQQWLKSKEVVLSLFQGTLFFSNSKDQRLYKQSISSKGMLKRGRVAGCDPTLVESPTEPKLSSKGSENAYLERSDHPSILLIKFSCPIILFQGLEDKAVPLIKHGKYSRR